MANQPVDMICFTGSSAVGRELAAVAGKKSIKAILELGGSNPAIILEDAHLESVIERIHMGRFINCGQVCDAIKRVICSS